MRKTTGPGRKSSETEVQKASEGRGLLGISTVVLPILRSFPNNKEFADLSHFAANSK